MSENKSKPEKLFPEHCDQEEHQYTSLEKCLLNDFQQNFPLTIKPYDKIAEELETDSITVIETIKKLQTTGSISRIGPIFKPNSVNASMLAALAVPEDKIVEVANFVNRYKEVNHNYEREHYFNLWFVLHAPDESHIHIVLDEIEEETELPLLRLPILDDYHIDLGFDLQWHQ